MPKLSVRRPRVAAACGAGVAALGVVLLLLTTGSAPGAPAGVGPATAGTAPPRLPGGTQLDPSRFASGACTEFPPTSGNRHATVFLDAGHGGIDPGGEGQTQSGAAVDESAVNLAVALEVTVLLRAEGYTVVDSRTGNTTVTSLGPGETDGGELSEQGAHDDVAARDVCANLAKAGVLVGVYMNTGAPGSAGCLTAYDADRPFAAASRRLAGLVQRDVLAAMNGKGWGIPDGGVRTDTGLGSGNSTAASGYGHLMLLGPAQAGYFDSPSQMPGALIEPLFLTDPFEGSIAASGTGQQVIADGLAKAIAQYLPG